MDPQNWMAFYVLEVRDDLNDLELISVVIVFFKVKEIFYSFRNRESTQSPYF